MSTRTETKAQQYLTRTARSFNETPTTFWLERLTEAARAVQAEAEERRAAQEARYLEMMDREPRWWDDASYAAYQAKD